MLHAVTSEGLWHEHVTLGVTEGSQRMWRLQWELPDGRKQGGGLMWGERSRPNERALVSGKEERSLVYEEFIASSWFWWCLNHFCFFFSSIKRFRTPLCFLGHSRPLCPLCLFYHRKWTSMLNKGLALTSFGPRKLAGECYKSWHICCYSVKKVTPWKHPWWSVKNHERFSPHGLDRSTVTQTNDWNVSNMWFLKTMTTHQKGQIYNDLKGMM